MLKKVKSSLFLKVFMITAILLAGVSFLVYGILAWYLPKTYSNDLNAALDEQTKNFISDVSQVPMEQSGGLFDRFLSQQNVDGMELFSDSGQETELPSLQNDSDGKVSEAVGNSGFWDNSLSHAPVISNSYPLSFPGENTQYTLVVYGAAEQIAELRQSFIRVLPLIAFVIVLVSLTASWIFSRLITKPVLKISNISKEMSQLTFEWQLEERRTDELGILEKSLNQLSRQLGSALNDLREANRKLELDIEHEKALEQAQIDFFSAVSHELKTPITIMKGQLEGMLLEIGAYKDHKKYLAKSLEVANTLETMVQDILIVSRLENPNTDFIKAPFDCVPFITQYLKETEDFIIQKELQVKVDLPKSAAITGNHTLLEKVFSNLIGNAVKYAPEGAVIHIIVQTAGGHFLFSVENTGTHIPVESIPKLFEAFYRVEQSRSRRTGGSGLGLYIVQKILHQHGSHCIAENTSTGVRFSFTI